MTAEQKTEWPARYACNGPARRLDRHRFVLDHLLPGKAPVKEMRA